ncbi:hypothetical protein Fot_03960 [Forsythia ovata]|uniref:BAG domain-containing protein n=1 Tax=Forsythia ovata TaxID=205694 RepID=A0ABD1XBT7_9LAMI
MHPKSTTFGPTPVSSMPLHYTYIHQKCSSIDSNTGPAAPIPSNAARSEKLKIMNISIKYQFILHKNTRLDNQDSLIRARMTRIDFLIEKIVDAEKYHLLDRKDMKKSNLYISHDQA